MLQREVDKDIVNESGQVLTMRHLYLFAWQISDAMASIEMENA